MNLTKALLIVTVGLSSFSYLPAHGFDGTRGGGDEVGLEFQSAFISALKTIQTKDRSLSKQLHDLDATSALINAKILTVDTDLKITEGTTIQISVAANDPQSATIWINRARWNAIQNANIRQGIALHEILSLLGIEGTGKYQISSQYVAYTGLKADVILSGGLRYSSPLDQALKEGAKAIQQQAVLQNQACREMVSKKPVQQVVNQAQAVLTQERDFCAGHLSILSGSDLYNAQTELNAASESSIGEVVRFEGCLQHRPEATALRKIENDLLEMNSLANRCAWNKTGAN